MVMVLGPQVLLEIVIVAYGVCAIDATVALTEAEFVLQQLPEYARR
jgi:hypothetical protein